MSYASCQSKQARVKDLFHKCSSSEQTYLRIIELGREQEPLALSDRVDENRVRGCQSLMYLRSEYRDGVMHFATESDALISAGLGQLLVRVYDGETPEAVLKCPPTFLEELGIVSSLTPGRANGLASLHVHMKQAAIRSLTADNAN